MYEDMGATSLATGYLSDSEGPASMSIAAVTLRRIQVEAQADEITLQNRLLRSPLDRISFADRPRRLHGTSQLF